jgi:hypothetical protein
MAPSLQMKDEKLFYYKLLQFYKNLPGAYMKENYSLDQEIGTRSRVISFWL